VSCTRIILLKKRCQGLDSDQRLPHLRHSADNHAAAAQGRNPSGQGTQMAFTELPWRMTVSWIQTSISQQLLFVIWWVDNHLMPSRKVFFPVNFIKTGLEGLFY